MIAAAARQHRRRNGVADRGVLERNRKELFAEGRIVQRRSQVRHLARPVIDPGGQAKIVLDDRQDFDRRVIFHQPREREHQPRDRGLIGRTGSVAACALGRELEPERSLFRDRDLVELRLARLGPDLAALVEQKSGVGNHVGLMLDQPSRAVAAAVLFIGGGQKEHVAVEQDSRPLDRQHRHQLDYPGALVVERAAPPDFAVLHQSREGRHLPLLGVGGHHVHVAQEHDRFVVLADSMQTRGDHRAVRLRDPDGGRDSLGEELLAQHLRRRQLVAGRIGGVDLDVPAEQVGGLGGYLVVVDRLGAGRALRFRERRRSRLAAGRLRERQERP